MNELVFSITQESDGGYVAEALGESIITQADTSLLTGRPPTSTSSDWKARLTQLRPVFIVGP